MQVAEEMGSTVPSQPLQFHVPVQPQMQTTLPAQPPMQTTWPAQPPMQTTLPAQPPMQTTLPAQPPMQTTSPEQPMLQTALPEQPPQQHPTLSPAHALMSALELIRNAMTMIEYASHRVNCVALDLQHLRPVHAKCHKAF